MSTLSRHPFFDTQEGLSPSPEHEWIRDYPISCRTMQRKPFFEGMGSAGAASRARRGRGAPLRRANVPQCSLPVVIGAPFSEAKTLGHRRRRRGGAKRYSRCRSSPPAASPQRGESSFRFRDFEAVLHTVKRVVKTQGHCSRRRCPPQQAR